MCSVLFWKCIFSKVKYYVKLELCSCYWFTPIIYFRCRSVYITHTYLPSWDFRFVMFPDDYLSGLLLQLSQRTISGSLLKYLSKLQVGSVLFWLICPLTLLYHTVVIVSTAVCFRWTKTPESGRTLQFFLAILQTTWMMGSVSNILISCYLFSLSIFC
jgi:hypothetical protein